MAAARLDLPLREQPEMPIVSGAMAYCVPLLLLLLLTAAAAAAPSTRTMIAKQAHRECCARAVELHPRELRAGVRLAEVQVQVLEELVLLVHRERVRRLRRALERRLQPRPLLEVEPVARGVDAHEEPQHRHPGGGFVLLGEGERPREGLVLQRRVGGVVVDGAPRAAVPLHLGDLVN